jgi:hypothetical protein
MSDKKVKELENEIKYAREVEQKFNSQDDEVYA